VEYQEVQKNTTKKHTEVKMNKSKDVSFQSLVDIAIFVGWDKFISHLEKTVYRNEIVQADLFAGTPSQVKEAVKLSKTIIQQNNTIARLKEYRKETYGTNQHKSSGLDESFG